MPTVPRSRSQLKATACALNGVPSVNVTPWRSVMVTVLASGLNEYPVARSGTTVPPAPSSKSCP